MDQNITMEEIWMLIQRLPEADKKVLRVRLNQEECAQESLAPYTLEELIQDIEEAERDYAEGNVYTSEEIHAEMREYVNELFAKKKQLAYAS